jgi:hypothetical protein
VYFLKRARSPRAFLPTPYLAPITFVASTHDDDDDDDDDDSGNNHSHFTGA